jgi:hypothetical protein
MCNAIQRQGCSTLFLHFVLFEILSNIDLEKYDLFDVCKILFMEKVPKLSQILTLIKRHDFNTLIAHFVLGVKFPQILTWEKN